MKFAKLELSRSVGETLIVRFDEKVAGAITSMVEQAFAKVHGPVTRFPDEGLARIAKVVQANLDVLAYNKMVVVSTGTETWCFADNTDRMHALHDLMASMGNAKKGLPVDVGLTTLVQKNREEAQAICNEKLELERKLAELEERHRLVDNEAVALFVDAFNTVPTDIQNKIKNRLNKKGAGAN